MITERINPDGSITIGIIEEEQPKEEPKAEPKKTVKKTTKKSK